MKNTKIKQLTSYFLISGLLFCSCSSSNDAGINEETAERIEEEAQQPTEDQKIIWKNWYLSVPINRGNGKATSIFYKTIVNEALTTAQSEYFYKNTDGSYTMFTKFTGITTSGQSALNDKYCRTELREFWRGNQDTGDNWSMSTGTHILESTLNVDFVEGNGRTIVAQIHGIETPGLEGSPATVKIRWNSGEIQIDHYTKPDSGKPWTSAFDEKINVGFVGNDIFTFKIKIENGKFYYALVCEAKNINTDLLFTGRFTHDNLDLALKSITQPLQLTYKKSNQTIILKRE
mgnify:CR=1 FL=1